MSPRRYLTPQDFRIALEQRLRSIAPIGATFVRTRQILVFDRFLARTLSEFRDKVLLKGGLALEMRLSRARTTKDVDLRLIGSSEDLLEGLQRAGRLDLPCDLGVATVSCRPRESLRRRATKARTVANRRMASSNLAANRRRDVTKVVRWVEGGPRILECHEVRRTGVRRRDQRDAPARTERSHESGWGRNRLIKRPYGLTEHPDRPLEVERVPDDELI